ncbi:MAG: DUF4400 domain-containing protein [Methylomonas sp.]|jgi:hypothetical protein
MGKHFLIWLMILFFTPLLFPMVLGPETLKGFINKDYNAAIMIFGGKELINQDLIAMYRKNLIVVAAVANEFRDRHDASAKFRNSGDPFGETIADIPGDWSESVKLEAYNLALRVVILSKWAVWLLIPMIMGFIAGVLGRRLKSETFSPPVPPIYNTATHLLLALTSMLLLWLMCPVPIPLSIIPTIDVLFSVFISLAVANYPKY